METLRETMHTQKKLSLVVGGIVLLIIGILIGRAISYQPNPAGSHRMPDGTMMNNMGSQSMQSMMHDMNASLEGKQGNEFDQAFLSEMIVHHEGAVAMAQKVLEVSQRPELIQLAHAIINAQTQEISQMHQWQQAWK